MNWLTDPESWLALLTLFSLEVVLGVDNIIFIAILTAKLPPERQGSARTIGLALALVTRIALLFSLAWLIHLTEPLFTVYGKSFAGRDLIFLIGGLFLLAKSTREIHARLEGEDHGAPGARGGPSYTSILVQIMLLDMVFSLDSIITAVGMVDEVSIMITAVVLAVLVMMFASGGISRFVERHPTIKMLALGFLILIGVTLIAEGWGLHIPKGYIYFAMGFSLLVEFLNIRHRKSGKRKNPSVAEPVAPL